MQSFNMLKQVVHLESLGYKGLIILKPVIFIVKIYGT
jgi:hypothetical protein